MWAHVCACAPCACECVGLHLDPPLLCVRVRVRVRVRARANLCEGLMICDVIHKQCSVCVTVDYVVGGV